MWWATYVWGWDVWYGSHLWVDIATAKWTPVNSIGDGTVVTAGFVTGRWNAVVIKHSFKWKYVYSNYAHLDKVTVKKWDAVKEWDKIGEVWNTGNSFGNHLHFQIDVNQSGSHPYYYSACKGDPMTIVNQWKCRDYLLENTIDPIEFLETNWASLDFKEDIKEVNEEKQEENKIPQTEIITREKLFMTELEMFFNLYSLDAKTDIPSNVLDINSKWNLIVTWKNKWRNTPFNDSLPQDITLSYDENVIGIFPNSITFLENGRRELKVTPRKVGSTTVLVKMWWRIISSIQIRVTTTGQKIDVSRAIIKSIWSRYAWSDNFWLLYMQDADYRNIIKVPYEGIYSLIWSSNVQLCKLNITSMQDLQKLNLIGCTSAGWTKDLTFSYKDTIQWIFLFKVRYLDTKKADVGVFAGINKIGNLGVIGSLSPLDLSTAWVNQSMLLNALSKWWAYNLRKWYFAPNRPISYAEAVDFVVSAFRITKEVPKTKQKTMTRLEFVKLLSTISGVTSKNDKKSYWDVDIKDKPYTDILFDRGITFGDGFSEKYFQPNKEITRYEVVLIISKILWSS